jgi:hypothetical protein
MAASDALYRLAGQARTAEDNVQATVSRDRGELEAKVADARASADAHADRLKAKSKSAADDAEGNWREMQRGWNEHVARIRVNIEDKKAQRDVDKAERAAQRAEDDALDAVDFAAATLEEAEYAVLDAALARRDADELAASA